MARRFRNKAHKRLLKRLPHFFDKHPPSNLWLFSRTVGKEFQEVIANTKLLSTIPSIERPLQIWRTQYQPHHYDIVFRVLLDDLYRVKLIDATKDKILYDSGILEDTSSLQDSVSLFCQSIIPERRFILEVDDWDGNTYQKGFPHNKTLEGDIFDHDRILDVIGNLLSIPRMRLDPPTDPDLYPRTYPPYCLDEVEWDYYYIQRIKKYLQFLNSKGLIHAEVYKNFLIEPIVSGLWRRLAKQNVAYQNILGTEEGTCVLSRNCMYTKNVNSSVFFVSAFDIDFPTNLPEWSEEEFTELAESLSSSKKFIFESTRAERLVDSLGIEDAGGMEVLVPSETFITTDIMEGSAEGSQNDDFTIQDAVSSSSTGSVGDNWQVTDTIESLGATGSVADNFNISDSIALDSTGSIGDNLIISGEALDMVLALQDSLVDEVVASDLVAASSSGSLDGDSFNSSDSVTASSSGSLDGDGFTVGSEGVSWNATGYIRVFDTDVEFQGMSRSNTIISGSGSSAVLTVPDPSTGLSTSYKDPNSVSNVDYSNCSSVGYWYNLNNAKVQDNTGATADTPAQVCYTDILRTSGYAFGVPSNAVITGIQVKIRRRQSGTSWTVNRVDQLVRINVGGTNSTSKAGTSNDWGQSYTNKYYGGSTDLWGLSNVTPSNINTLYVDLSAKNNYSSAGATFYVDVIQVNVYYDLPQQSGTASYTLLGSEISAFTNLGYLEYSTSIPSGCSITATIKKNNEVVKTSNLSSGTNTLDLTDISVSSTDQFVVMFELIASGTSKPSIDYIKHQLTASN